MEFPKYPKTPRFNMECLVTEKIDGTNALLHIDLEPTDTPGECNYVVRAGSRKRWITPENDNFGFAKFVKANEMWLIENLGVGTHYGEWYGSGIQRGYGLDHKRLALFDGPGRYPWAVDQEKTAVAEQCGDDDITYTRYVDLEGGSIGVVPLLYQGGLDNILSHINNIEALRSWLLPDGSKASPGWLATEGVIVQLRGSGGGQRFKIVWDK